MDWIEIIQLKAFTGTDWNAAIAAFGQLTPPLAATGLKEINLFKNLNQENELSILIGWRGGKPQRGKSSLGIQLATAFAEFGHIYHSGWKHSHALTLQPWRIINEQQTAV